ncbi:MAG: DEAD/DEAH box helicase, partial [Candidatus Micrarchaeota archaeon]
VLILAPTGSGKTESALLPVLEKITEAEQGTGDRKPGTGNGGPETGDREHEIGGGGPDAGGIHALYITPLRALSRDLKDRFDWWCERLSITHDIRTGDTTQSQRAKHRRNPPKILLTTVESLQALLLGKIMRRHLASVRFVIVDEVHDILDNKRGAQLSMGLERLGEIAEFQRIAISATVANENEAAKLVFGKREFALCESGKHREMELSVEHIGSKEKRLERIKELSEKNRSLIFVNTRSYAEELGASLMKMGAPIGVHHGSLGKDVRLATEDEFKSGKLNSIVCTSSLELGIDVGDVSLAMQYGSPHQVFRLIQRVGRSGHSLQKIPKGVMFPSDFDDMLESEVIVALAKSGRMEDKAVERGALDVIGHQLIGLCLDFGRMELERAHAILSRSYAYGIPYDKLRMIALQLHGEGLLFYDEHAKGISIKAMSRARSYYGSFLSTIPKTKRFLMKDITANKIIASLDEEFVVGLEEGASFLSHGMPWRVVDITDTLVLAEPTSATDIMVPSWTGEDIPVSYEVAQGVGRMRTAKRDVSPMPDDKTVILECIGEIVVIHACFGTRINECISRIFSKKLSNLIGESVISVADPYRIMMKLPFPLKAEVIERSFKELRGVRRLLEDALDNSPLVRFKFLHVGRMFGLLSEDASVSSRFVHAMRHSLVYEETLRAIFFRYFDVEGAEGALSDIKRGKLRLVVDERKKPSFFANVGLERVSGSEAVGAFQPREKMVDAFRENALSRTVQLKCLHCGTTRFMHLAGAPERIGCHKCGTQSLAYMPRETTDAHAMEFSAGLIRAYGKRALIALSSYGIGPATADRVLKKLQRSEEAFYLDLIEAQKNFIKNKKYWKLD